jgi:hypothetical protein
MPPPPSSNSNSSIISALKRKLSPNANILGTLQDISLTEHTDSKRIRREEKKEQDKDIEIKKKNSGSQMKLAAGLCGLRNLGNT